jgi:hypothetical protein
VKVLLAIQFYNGDQTAAEEVARLIADLTPRHRKDVDFMFASRFDCDVSPRIVDYVSRKFDVFSHKGRRREIGWPAGCNALWFDTMAKVYEQSRAKKMPVYDWILTFEGDTAPLCPDWVDKLNAEWVAANKERRVDVMGALLPAPVLHCNGNALFSGRLPFLQHLAEKVLGCSSRAGWDCILAPMFKQFGWHGSNQMICQWNRYGNIIEEELDYWLNEGMVFHHGIKNPSLLDLVNDKWLPRETPVRRMS